MKLVHILLATASIALLGACASTDDHCHEHCKYEHSYTTDKSDSYRR
jgi:hypothetical protein